MNVANNNNQRKNENNNNNNQNNNNNINEGVVVLLNEFENMVTASGTGVPMMGRKLRRHRLVADISSGHLPLHLHSLISLVNLESPHPPSSTADTDLTPVSTSSV